MFCGKCGTKLEDGATTCPSCGTEVVIPTTPVQPTPVVATPATENVTSAVEKPAKEKKEHNVPKIFKNKFFYIGIGAFLAVLALVLILVNQPKKFNVEKYITVTFDGYDGFGTAKVKLDKSTLIKDINAKVGKKQKSNNALNTENLIGAMMGNTTTTSKVVANAVNSIKLDVSDTTNLKNGDVITVKITYNNTLAKAAKIKFKGSTYKATVKDLEEVDEIDAFDGFTINFEGIAPYGRCTFNYNGDNRINTYSFSSDKSINLKNGDVVTITFNMSEKDTVRRGFKVKEAKKEFTVSGLDEYVSNITDIDDSYIKKLKSEAEDTITAYISKSYGDQVKASKLEYAGYILLSGKEVADNTLYFIYTATVSHEDDKFNPTVVYYPVGFNKIIKKASDYTYAKNTGIIGSASITGSSSLSTKGYINPILAYENTVGKNADNYNITSGDGFEKYAEKPKFEKLSDLSDDYRKELQNSSLESINKLIENYNAKISATDPEYFGEILLINKNQGNNYANNNKYYQVYKTTVTYSDSKYEPTTLYYTVEYDGVVKLPDNKYMVTASKGVTSPSARLENGTSVKGFVDTEKLYKTIITNNVDNFTFDCSSSIKNFEEKEEETTENATTKADE